MKPKCVNCGKEITGDYVEVLDYRVTDAKLYYVRNSWKYCSWQCFHEYCGHIKELRE